MSCPNIKLTKLDSSLRRVWAGLAGLAHSSVFMDLLTGKERHKSRLQIEQSINDCNGAAELDCKYSVDVTGHTKILSDSIDNNM